MGGARRRGQTHAMSIRALIPATVAAALLLVPAAAPADPVLTGSAPVSGIPGRIAQGFDGNDWVAIGGAKLGRVAPDGTVTEFPSPGGVEIQGLVSGPSAAGGPDDRIWLSYNGGVAAWNPATNTGQNFPVATINAAQGIARDNDGNLWVVDSNDGMVEVAPNGTKIQDVAVAGSSGRDIALGSDGRLWWVDFALGKVHATTTANPAVTSDFNIGGNGPQAIAAGPAGLLAFGNPGTNPQSVGTITTGGDFKTVNTALDPFGVAYGGDGAFWFARFAGQDLARLTTDGTLTTPITFPANSGPRRIAAGPNGTLFVSLETAKAIARVTGVTAPPPPPAATTDAPAGDAGPAPTTLPDKTAPAISRFSLAPKAFAIGSTVGTIAYTLSEGGSVVVTIEKVKTGHKRGGRCRATGKGKACVRYVQVKRFRHASVAGTNGLRFTGQFGRQRLSAGTYRLTIVAFDAVGNASPAAATRFRVSSGK